MRILKWILIIFGIFVVLLLLLLFLNDKANQKVSITRYTYTDSEIPSAFDGCKIMMISDLHNADFSEDIVEHIKNEKPDYVVMTGDMVQLPDTSIENTLKIADEVTKMNIPIYAVSGNHDRQCGKYDEIIASLWAHGVYMLEYDSVRFEKDGESIVLMGIQDPRHDVVTDEKIAAIRGNIKNQLSRREDYFTILLSHRADLYPQIKDTGVDLILSGHLHGGVVRLPFVGGIVDKDKKISFSSDYDYGVYEEDGNATMIVSGGCDKNPKKRRFFNPPEILLITLKGE
ncbi:MAG: hypothetical protein E7406_06140 [Ruminococcaceae bacterium]|nr:hypothetical protein [Oscillospiraceae bacterium]